MAHTTKYVYGIQGQTLIDDFQYNAVFSRYDKAWNYLENYLNTNYPFKDGFYKERHNEKIHVYDRIGTEIAFFEIVSFELVD